jgi:hypothetical protein
MDQLELIRTTHEIDRSLARIAEAVSDERLKHDVVTLHAQWRELGYQVTAALCGMEANGAAPVRRRGRRRKADVPVDGDDRRAEPRGEG